MADYMDPYAAHVGWKTDLNKSYQTCKEAELYVKNPGKVI